MRPDASASEIRDAYRRLARTHHPDTRGGDASAEMAAINEAWRVLSDPGRRLDHDRELRAARAASAGSAASSSRSSSSGASSGARPSDPPLDPRLNPIGRYTDPPRFPWRFVVIVAVLGIAAVLIAGALTGPGAPAPVDNVLRNGECVLIEPSLRVVSEVACAEPHDAVVVELVPTGQRCATGLEAFLDRQGMGTACVQRP